MLLIHFTKQNLYLCMISLFKKYNFRATLVIQFECWRVFQSFSWLLRPQALNTNPTSWAGLLKAKGKLAANMPRLIIIRLKKNWRSKHSFLKMFSLMSTRLNLWLKQILLYDDEKEGNLLAYRWWKYVKDRIHLPWTFAACRSFRLPSLRAWAA